MTYTVEFGAMGPSLKSSLWPTAGVGLGVWKSGLEGRKKNCFGRKARRGLRLCGLGTRQLGYVMFRSTRLAVSGFWRQAASTMWTLLN